MSHSIGIKMIIMKAKMKFKTIMISSLLIKNTLITNYGRICFALKLGRRTSHVNCVCMVVHGFLLTFRLILVLLIIFK
jgi:hypothetical protein